MSIANLCLVQHLFTLICDSLDILIPLFHNLFHLLLCLLQIIRPNTLSLLIIPQLLLVSTSRLSDPM